MAIMRCLKIVGAAGLGFSVMGFWRERKPPPLMSFEMIHAGRPDPATYEWAGAPDAIRPQRPKLAGRRGDR